VSAARQALALRTVLPVSCDSTRSAVKTIILCAAKVNQRNEIEQGYNFSPNKIAYLRISVALGLNLRSTAAAVPRDSFLTHLYAIYIQRMDVYP
jgi:hypothetical protein